MCASKQMPLPLAFLQRGDPQNLAESDDNRIIPVTCVFWRVLFFQELKRRWHRTVGFQIAMYAFKSRCMLSKYFQTKSQTLRIPSYVRQNTSTFEAAIRPFRSTQLFFYVLSFLSFSVAVMPMTPFLLIVPTTLNCCFHYANSSAGGVLTFLLLSSL